MSDDSNPSMKAGMIGWNELITTDVEAAARFYGESFGWTVETTNIGPGWDYHMFRKGDAMVGGMFGATPEMGPVPPHWLAYLMSDDLDADLEKVRAAGGTVIKEPMEVPGTGTFAVIQDPQGAVIALWRSACGAQC